MNANQPVRSHSFAVAEPSDELTALVVRARAGCLAAQSELVRRYTRRVSGLLRRIVPVRSAVEDVGQEVFIKMVRRLGRLRDPSVFECWLFTMARNAGLDFIRRQRCQPATVNDSFLMLSAPESESAQAVSEIMAAFECALVRLNAKDRQLITLIVQGHSYGIVAARAGLSVGAVKLRIHRARPLLRLSMSEAVGARARSTKTLPPSSRISLAA